MRCFTSWFDGTLAAKTNDIKVACFPAKALPCRPSFSLPALDASPLPLFPAAIMARSFVTLTSIAKNGDCAATAYQALSLLAAKRRRITSQRTVCFDAEMSR